MRGKGLLNAIVIERSESRGAWQLCLLMKKRGLLAKPTHRDIIRLAPPLCITEEQLGECAGIIADALDELAEMSESQLAALE